MGGTTHLLWIRNGIVDSAGPDDEIDILLDIGALDIKERATQPGTKAVVLTEDEKVRPLEALLKSSGFILDETVILSYQGVSTIKQLRPLVRIIQTNNAQAKIVLHRDRDYRTDEEVQEWEQKVRQLGVEPFSTTGVDVESHFLNASHLDEVNELGSKLEFEDLIQRARESTKEKSIERYVNGRIEVERKKGGHTNINHGSLAVEATKAVQDDLAGNSHSKTVLKQLRNEFRVRYRIDLQVFHSSNYIAVPELKTVSNKAFRQAARKPS